MSNRRSTSELPLTARIGSWGYVCRLGLATRGNSQLDADEYLRALDRGINYFNWCGYPDGLSDAVRRLGSRRREICLSAQFEARTASAATNELDQILDQLGTDYLDVLTYYYVEEPGEWEQITGPGGVAETLARAQGAGRVRMIGLTSHQRELAAGIATSGAIDLLMIRYNAAHRGAERQIFPVTEPRGMPVIAYTALRWQALLQATPDDPPGFVPPTASECYRFVLGHPAVTVVIAAPNSRTQLEEDLAILDAPVCLSPERYAQLQAHGDRVRRHAGSFP
jgi:predicted aldo/keto reductase-like oxidoreductase